MHSSIQALLYSHFDHVDNKIDKALTRYIKFVDWCRTKTWDPEEYCETHHIVPVSWGGTNDKNNLIKFPYRAHIIAHQLLARTDDPDMVIAASVILAHFPQQAVNFVTLREAEYLRKRMAIAKSATVVNLTTGEHVLTYDLAKKYNCGSSSVLGCIQNKTKFKGDYYCLPEQLENCDYHQILDSILKEKQIIKENCRQAIRIANGRPIINLNTGETYISVTDAVKSSGQSMHNMTALIKAISVHKCKFNGCYWQYKDIVDQTSIKEELQKYIDNAKQQHINSVNKRKKAVINLNTGETFDSAKAAKEYYGVEVNGAIRNQQKAAGYYWMYVKDMTMSRDEELQRLIDRSNNIQQKAAETRLKNIKQSSNPIICLQTRQVYENACVASRELGITSEAQLYSAIKMLYRVKGLYYCSLEDYNELGEDKIWEKIQKRKEERTGPTRSVINLNTGEIFANCTDPCKKYLSKDNVATVSSYISTNSKLKGCYYQYLDVVEASSIEEELQKCLDRAAQESEARRQKTLKRVVNLTTGEEFESAVLAATTYNAKYKGYISTAIRTKRPFAGCFWIYKKDLKNSVENTLNQYIDRYNNIHPDKPYTLPMN